MKNNITILLSMIISLLFYGCKKNTIIYQTIYLEEAFSIVPIITIMDTKEVILNLDIEEDLNEIIQNLDQKFNVFNTNSMISNINNNSGKKAIEVDDEFIYVLSQAIDIADANTFNGQTLYDVSIYPIWKEWKFNENYYYFNNYSSSPSLEVIKQKLPLVNYKNIIIDKTKKTVYLKNEGMMIDLGSIVKGYAADKISNYLLKRGLNNCLIDVGGNIITLGKNIGTNKKWKTGISMPYQLNKEIGYIEANESKESFVTSGIYQRYIVEKNNETNQETIYHHILNPLTGYPENNHLLSVTIISKQSIIGDGYSTSIFLLGLEKGLEYVNNNDEIEALFVTDTKEIILSKGLKDRFVISNESIVNGYKIK